jgi:exo-1,4-beta-D-glucosaminidase
MIRVSSFFLVCAAFVFGSYSLQSSAESPNGTELRDGWRMASASNVSADAAEVSSPTFDTSTWYVIPRMPSTVLQVLADNHVYENLYYGMNLSKVPELWRQDWWYRTTFPVPAGRLVYSLIFKGINYRADVWVNGHKVANRSQIAGMYSSFEINVTEVVRPGSTNVLAVKVIPERTLTGENGLELGDSWLDWINWKYLGYHDAEHHLDIPFVADRNAGVWKRVYLSSTGAVTLRNPYVVTDLPLPATSPAALTVYCDLTNNTANPISGTLLAEISRPGKLTIRLQKGLSLVRGETREITLAPSEFSQLSVTSPDLWWPYRWGRPDLYHLKLEFRVNDDVSDEQAIEFGIRKIMQRRDSDNNFRQFGTGGNFYLQVNGKDYLIRGGVYSPDLLFRNDPDRDATIIKYVKDLGLNLIRWELKIADDTMIEQADREGVPVMLGWMCCAQWEHWDLWGAEDQWIARASLRARIRELRAHASVVLWANGSDGLPPDSVLKDYQQILEELHWQNAVVDTVSHVNRKWSGIHMAGPYVWRPPYYWFSDRYGPARGSSAEEGDNETIPPLESLKKFIPQDHLWPIDEYWHLHSGANEGNNTLSNIQRVLNTRYGPSASVEEFSRKAQLAHYEDVRAQFESYATHWGNRKMLVHWMMNNPWPSLFGHLFDAYFKQGGGYFGAKKALRPINVIWDYYATGDRNTAKVYVANESKETLNNLRVLVAFYNLAGERRSLREVKGLSVGPNSSLEALSVERISLDPVYLVRCEVRDESDRLLANNVYWQSTSDDDLGPPQNDEQFKTTLLKWADFAALNRMPSPSLELSGTLSQHDHDSIARITLKNPTNHIAFFVRVEVTKGNDGEEILPIVYDDNYVTVFPHESLAITATFRPEVGLAPELRVEGLNVAKRASGRIVDLGK